KAVFKVLVTFIFLFVFNIKKRQVSGLLVTNTHPQTHPHTHTHVRAHTHTNSATPGHMHMLLKTFDCSVTLLLSFTEARNHSELSMANLKRGERGRERESAHTQDMGHMT